MGDFLSPQKRELADRLRRRIENYRQHHPNAIARYQRAIDCLYAQQRRDTEVYHRKWLESKAKKAAKSSRATKDGVNSQNTQLQLKKRKLDSTSSATSEPPGEQPSASYANDSASPAGKRSKADAGTHVSVQIHQKTSQPDSRINVTVGVNCSTFTGNNNSPSGAKIHTSTSVECKTEPKEEPLSNNPLSPLGSEDDLKDILDLISQDNGHELFDKDLENLLDVHGNHLDSDEIPEGLNMFSPGSMHNASSPMSHPPPEYTDSVGLHPDSHHNNGNDNNSNTNGMNRNIHPGHHTPPVSMATNVTLPSYQTAPPPHQIPPASQGHPQGPPVSAPYFNQPTGPAAETLKQLAMKNSQGGSPIGYQRQGSYPGYPGQQNFNGPPQPGNGYPFNGGIDPRQAMVHKNQDMITYAGTKPLSHYADPMGQGSQQQIPHPMRTHMPQHPPSQATHMQVNQMQNMSVSSHRLDARQHVQMNQQMQASMQGHTQMSMSQQQSFSIAQSQEAAFRNEQLKMKLIHQQKLQQEQAAAMKSQYPSRPPPEYKMPPGKAGYPQQIQQQMGPNHPLQTIQNMIKQTSETFNTAVQHGGIYGTVKTENQGQPMQNQANMPGQPHAHLPPIRNNSPQLPVPHDGFQGQQVVRQQGYTVKLPPGGAASHSLQPSQARPTKPATPTYTSALMRNERPPNVDVGPSGLNISQQRPVHPEWGPRGMPPNYQQQMPMMNVPTRLPVHYTFPGQQGAPRPQVHPQHALNIQMSQQQVMRSSSLPNGTTTLQQQQQQQHEQIMMQQQQNLRMAHHPVQGVATGSHSVAMSASQTVSFSQQHHHQHQQGQTQDNFPLDFLDHPQHGASDLLDQMAQSDYNLLDDILGT